MANDKKTKLLIYYVVFSLFFCFHLSSCVARKHSGNLVLINNTNMLITDALIEVCNQRVEFKDVKPREKREWKFNITHDSHYKITIVFATGNNFVKELGYVTRGFDFQHILAVTEVDILLIKSQVVR